MARMPLTPERIGRALVIIARVVLRHGPQYAALLERLEKDLETARRHDPAERARQILQAYTADGGTNAIRSSQDLSCFKDRPTP